MFKASGGAPLKKRLLAGFIDFLGIMGLGTIIDFSTANLIEKTFTTLDPNIVSAIIFLLVLWGVLCALHHRWGRTPGKIWVHLKLAQYPGSLAPVAWRMYLRCFLFPFSFVAYAFGFLMILFHPKRRGLHDLLSGTWVISEDPAAQFESAKQI